jgi:uncharacterized membrane protein YgcG
MSMLTGGYAGFALSAALAQTLAPTDTQVVNLLGFHVIAKLLVHYPAYVGNVAVVRTVARRRRWLMFVRDWRLGIDGEVGGGEGGKKERVGDGGREGGGRSGGWPAASWL